MQAGLVDNHHYSHALSSTLSYLEARGMKQAGHMWPASLFYAAFASIECLNWVSENSFI
jgi:hypothetical protein